MTLADGSVYVGEYKGGLKDGYGKLTLPDGTSMEGTFTDDLRNGTFKEYDANGNFVRTLTFVNGMSR